VRLANSEINSKNTNSSNDRLINKFKHSIQTGMTFCLFSSTVEVLMKALMHCSVTVVGLLCFRTHLNYQEFYINTVYPNISVYSNKEILFTCSGKK
jgi:hypothetical protein